jgi:hypothetical protein
MATERVYARETAGRLGVELVELVEDESAPDFAKPSAPSFRPPATALLRSYRRLVSDQLRAMGADWSVNGAGGDNIFASLNSAGPVLDALRVGGVRAAATAAADVGGIHNATRWHVLRLAGPQSAPPAPRAMATRASLPSSGGGACRHRPASMAAPARWRAAGQE